MIIECESVEWLVVKSDRANSLAVGAAAVQSLAARAGKINQFASGSAPN